MLDSPIIQVLVGLVLVFFVFSTLCSGAAELVNRAFNMRASYLLRGIGALLDGAGPQQRTHMRPPRGDPLPPDAGTAPNQPAPATLAERLLKLPIVGAFGQQNDGDPTDKKKSPSYLPARVFSAGLMDILLGTPKGTKTLDNVIDRIEQLNEPARGSLLALAKTAEGSVAQFRASVEHWYDDQMDRVSGWYKRHIRLFVIGFAVAFTLLFNLNVVTLARTLYADPSSRQALVAQANALEQCPADQRDQCTKDAATTVAQLGKTSLLLFWQPTNADCATRDADTNVSDNCSFWSSRDMHGYGWWLAFLGWVIAAAALSMGGPFWFDLLGRLASLRGTGPPPDKSTASPNTPTTTG